MQKLGKVQAKREKPEAISKGAQIESHRQLALHYEQVGQAKVVKARTASAAADVAAADVAAAYSTAQSLFIDADPALKSSFL